MSQRERVGASGTIAFAPYRLDAQESCLWRGSRRIPLSATDSAILAYLVSRAGRLVTRDELLGALWPGVFVTPGVVKVRVRRLRRTLRDRVTRPRFIETVHGRGYRFIAKVSELGRADAEPVSAQRDMLRHLCRAARNAIRRRAPHEVIAVARRALPLLPSLTDPGERAGTEQEYESRSAVSSSFGVSAMRQTSPPTTLGSGRCATRAPATRAPCRDSWPSLDSN